MINLTNDRPKVSLMQSWRMETKERDVIITFLCFFLYFLSTLINLSRRRHRAFVLAEQIIFVLFNIV